MKALHLPAVSVRSRVIACLKDATAMGQSLSVQQIADQTDIEPARVRHAIGNLLGQHVVSSVGGAANCRLYCIAVKTKASKATTREISTANRKGDYEGIELARNPGLQPERFTAYALPSRINDRLHWPDGRVTRLDGGALRGSGEVIDFEMSAA